MTAVKPSPVAHPFDCLGPVAKALWIGCITVIVGLFLALISSNLPVQEIAKRMTTRIYAPFLTLNYSTQGRDTITIMTLDDVDLQSYGLSWPVPLDYYQRLIDRVVTFQPRAIFIDVLFLDNRDNQLINKLRQSTCRASDAGVPIFIATMARPDGTLADAKPSFLPTSNVEEALFNARNSAGQPCVIPTLATIAPDKLDQSQWQYPLGRNAENKRSSVALAMFCHFNMDQCPRDVSAPQALIWGTRAAPTNEETMISRNAEGGISPVCRSQWQMREAIPGVSLVETLITHKPLLPLCPYHQVIPVRAFQYLDSPVSGDGFSAAEMKTALNGKMVMLGADLAAYGDNVVSPFHGRLPGVHVHAMALDNLIETRGRYVEDGEFGAHHGWNTRTNWFTLLAIISTATTLSCWSLIRRRPRLPNEGPRTLRQAGLIKTFFHRFYARSKHVKNYLKKRPVIWVSTQFLIFLLLLVPTFFAALLGYPKATTEKFWIVAKWSIAGALVYGMLSLVLLWLGYGVFRQGPLVIIEYVMFPLLAHFTHLGEILAKRVYLWYASLKQPSPLMYIGSVNAASAVTHAD